MTNTMFGTDPWRLNLKLGDEVLGVTQEHPFLVIKKGWVRADQLLVGDKIKTLGSNIGIEVISIEGMNGFTEVYNIEVEGFHNYFVTKSEILVHNATWKPAFHHFVNRFMGSKTAISFLERLHGQAGKLNAFRHIRLHRELNSFLLNYRTRTGINLLPSRSNPTAAIRKIDRSIRLRALTEFYRTYQNGKYFKFYQAELKAMVQKGVGLDPALFE